jgi:glycosyltransferase involved in cell wall biosynthesis
VELSVGLRVALDVTPLLGAHTGVAAFTTGALAALAPRTEVELRAYAVTWRGRARVAGVVPAGVAVAGRPMAARPLRGMWRRFDVPPIEWWTGAIDVVHGTNFVVPPAARAAEVVTVHDLTPVRYPQMSTRDTLQYPGLLRRALQRGAVVHTPSRFVAEEVVDLLGAAPDRVHAVHHGVPPIETGDPAGGRRRAGGDRYVLALGTVEPRKDLRSLVRAFETLADDDDDLRLVIAGPDGWGVQDLEAAITGARHRDRIVRLGWVTASERAGLLAGAAVFAYPSVYEGFGFPPLEAMAVGVPVVASTAGALPEVLGDAADLVAPGDTDALAGALRRVLGDDARRAALVRRGRDQVARYSWEECGDGLLAVYGKARG